ncbi:MAG: multidrug efflux pump subunit AcrB [Chlamydiales bacterium]|jgi:multidrug efflux pump subunit AcrB
MGLVRFALKNPYTVIVSILAVVVLGTFSFTLLPADLLRVFKTPAVQIVTLYPGMPPEVVERDIMSRLQRWTGQSVGISHQEAKAMQGVCIVKDFFREDIDEATAMSQVTSLAMSDMYYLPPGTLPPIVIRKPQGPGYLHCSPVLGPLARHPRAQAPGAGQAA